MDLKKTISFTRVLMSFFIFLCHTLSYSSNKYIALSTNFFNVGVYVFLLISGFLYSNKDINRKFDWIISRWIRITVPVVIFLFMIIPGLVIDGYQFKFIYLFTYIFNLEIFSSNIAGMTHLWFLSVIMICYTLICILDFRKMIKKNNFIITTLIFNIIATIFLFIGNKSFITFTIDVYVFFIGYWLGFNYKKFINHSSLLYILVILISLCVRIISRLFLDDTGIYYFIVSYSSTIIGISIFVILLKRKNSINNCNLMSKINYLDRLSYYFYITHYSFIIYPYSLLKMSEYLILNIIIMFSMSFFIADILMRISTFTINKINNIIYRH